MQCTVKNVWSGRVRLPLGIVLADLSMHQSFSPYTQYKSLNFDTVECNVKEWKNALHPVGPIIIVVYCRLS